MNYRTPRQREARDLGGDSAYKFEQKLRQEQSILTSGPNLSALVKQLELVVYHDSRENIVEWC